MAALTQDQCRQVYTTGVGPRRWSLFALFAVSAADTADLAALGYFRKVSQAMLMGATLTASVSAPFTGAVVTLPAGLNNDSGYLLVDGIPV